MAHLSRRTPTLFEVLDDAGLRTAGTTFLMYRGRHRHEATGETALARLVTATLFRHAVWGPRELFYADLFASRETGCKSQLGLPGARDDHSGWSISGLRLPWRSKIAAFRCRSYSPRGSASCQPSSIATSSWSSCAGGG